MGEPKAFASLSSGLLARKGAARPAMRPQGFGQSGSGLEDLGWNDMGFEPPKPADGSADETHDAFGAEIQPHPVRNPLAGLTPVGSPVHDQQAEIADRLVDCTDEGEEVDETAEMFEADEEPLAAALAGTDQAGTDQTVVELPAAFEPTETASFAPAPVAVVKAPGPRRVSRPRSAPGSKGKAAFTLRLDKQRHLKLRLACAVSGRSAQQLVTDALDQLLQSMPELDSMAEKAPLAKRA
ncbi:hypothetical protein G7076_05570 [Sphingomonas sp. HDW15A]|uniref:hypothetical protein n=1 Tax=Sphingomonas sp. HDW15A TaxID=2714942 RepID=UPI00140A04CD|nr:hypothetical protein [Sphingomonas sp. HDW15A]QIK95998.1 hypothetical protein G7076_05570 [Sphingomonas sp. HDW15A]